MRFIITIEDDGYELRYWNEMTEEIGETFAQSWTKKEFYDILKQNKIKIKIKDLKKCFKVLNDEQLPFVVLKSKENNNMENLINENFIIDEELTYGNK